MNQEYLKSILDYEPESGTLIWKWRPDIPDGHNRRWAGKIAGHRIWSVRHNLEYVGITINGKQYYAHHLVWLWIYGEMPFYLDHKDGNGVNNRIDNLREATHSQNMANKQVRFSGVSIKNGRYRARIGFCGTRYHLGYFDTAVEAEAAYRKAHLELFGEFSSQAEVA